ncbi:MAG: hypothetical protein M3Y59_16850 [Myxococcota bacterium]|nr:hypothetical protein [Myxococcota bacterium]
MRNLVLSAFFLATTVAGCSHLKNDRTVCPEYRDLRCVGAPECSMNQERGCRVCQCGSLDPDQSDPSGRQPDQRNPDPTAVPR